MTNQASPDYTAAVAIVGMAGRFPGAHTIEQFWDNIAGGVRSIRMFTDEELLAAGVDPETLRQPNFVKAGTVIDGADLFDAGFFGYPPREAEIMDPQHRLFLECTWEALERAAYDPETYKGLIGVFAGSCYPTYMHNNLLGNAELVDNVGMLQITVGNEADSLASTVSYKLNLRGPSVAVQTFCSTSLVAVHLAYQSLITYESDMAVAGGVAIAFPQGSGYEYQEGGIVSPDGYCRTFDGSAQGSVMGNGLGVVVLKRMDEALRDGDQIYAVIKGSALNNDGIRKVGYTAPGLAGQTSVIVRGLNNAGVKAETISYIEAHGTATPLGDSVELSSLIRAFSRSTKKKQFCALGSVKPNIGHLDRASGVTGLIKTALALTHKQLPPLLHFEQPSPDIDLANSPFYVNTELRPWPAGSTPRRAGVSSFGLGGTNAHVVLEEAPSRPASHTSRPYHLLLLSAKTESALEAMTANLVAHLREHPELNPADVAYTLQVGRSAFNHRRAVVYRDLSDVADALDRRDAARVHTLNQTSRDRAVAFLFPGHGERSNALAWELYQHEAPFRATVDHCAALLRQHAGLDIHAALNPALRGSVADSAALVEPLLFVVEYALAHLLRTWGIEPQAMLGYGVGEYVAACVSGVLSLEDALRLVATRAQLIAQLPASAMLSVALNESAVQPYLNTEISLAAIDGPTTCVLAGSPAAITALAARLDAAQIACGPVADGHALHGAMLAPVADELTALARSLTLSEPKIAYLSNVSGTWITAEQATDPAYWAQHLLQPVRFADGVQTLLLQAPQALLEVGPGQTLSTLARQHPICTAERTGLVLSMLADNQAQSGAAALLEALAQLWLLGVPIDWERLYSTIKNERRYRLALPTYPFARQRYWIESSARAALLAQRQQAIGKRPDPADWFYQPVWQTTPLPTSTTPSGRWLILADQHGLGTAMAERLSQVGVPVTQVVPGDQFAQLAAGRFQLRPDNPADYHELLTSLRDTNMLPTHVVHLWSLDSLDATGPDRFRAAQERGFYSVLFLTQALSAHLLAEPLQMLVASNGLHAVSEDEIAAAEHATLPGLCTVIGQEHVNITCHSVDVQPTSDGSYAALVEPLLAEAQLARADAAIAYRDGARLAQSYTALRIEPTATIFRQRGVYLITGGLGGIGLVLADYLARTYQARLVLAARTALPPRERWQEWLDSHMADDRTSVRIRKVQNLEALGGEVLVLGADVADMAQMQAALAETRARFGQINGVLYTAGTSDPSAFGALESLTREQCEAHFQPKAHGLYTLEAALADQSLDFCLLFSSISALLGGLTLGAYAAANSFIDAFTQRHNRTHPVKWLSVNWDTWHLRADQHAVIGATVAQYEMLPAEGAQAVERLIAQRGYHRIINSTGDLEARISQWIRMDALRGAAAEDERSTGGLQRLGSADYEQRITAIWQDVLGIQEVGLHDNFFDLGGNSLNGLQVMSKIKKIFKVQIPVVALFEAPTVSALAEYLRPKDAPAIDRQEQDLRRRRQQTRAAGGSQDIAIISMAGRFPGASTVEQFWQNLYDGVESITHFTDAELLAAGVDPQLIQNPAYVKARPILDNVDQFDAAFFGYTPREAELMDPQQRLFHECAWEALELAGYDTQRYKGLIGVFAGANLNVYLMRMFADPALMPLIDDSTVLENDKDALATNIAYKLNLRGPSFAVQTFCSTSLVATHLACRSLIDGECDIALAGGVSVRVPVKAGYLYVQGDQTSPDGHCRTFDAESEGATFGDGVAIVVLKRLDDALADGDTIHAVIRGSAINNDGGRKVGYTAPSVVGQAEVVTTALERAGVEPTTIGYVEAHGTATRLGDPIEVASLTKAFRTFTDQTQFCVIGSAKPNVGHLDRASGVTGLIKTTMMLKHGVIPALLHFQSPNPEIDFANSPFVVTNQRREWPRGSTPRRAGVNSLGVGGTNAHLIVEEPPALPAPASSRPQQLLLLSARTPTALDAATANLAAFLREHPDANLADVAYTLQVGRRRFEHRRMLVCRDTAEAITLLNGAEPQRVLSHAQKPAERPVAFLFPGVGDHYTGLARDLYQHEPVFRATVERCCRLLQPHLGRDLQALLYPATPNAPTTNDTAPTLDFAALLGRSDKAAPDALHETALAQPAVFVVEYALAQLLQSWGVEPQAMLGYSLGEYVAACVSGVLSLEDALRLVATRARLIAQLPVGSMLAVALSEADVQPYLSDGVCLAVVNGPSACVLAGPSAAIEAVAARLEAQEIACRPVATTHAFHSTMLAPVADQLTALARSLTLNEPKIPYLSNVTGTWITAEQATDPAYWARHMVETVRFADGIETLLHADEHVLLEVGPGQTLGFFARQHPACTSERAGRILHTLRGRHERQDDQALLLTTLGRLWLLDVPIDWAAFAAHEQRRRIPLPTYPFERQHFWLDPQQQRSVQVSSATERRADLSDWFAIPSWKRGRPIAAADVQERLAQPQCWLLLADECGIGQGLERWLDQRGQHVFTVTPGDAFARTGPASFTVRPNQREDYDTLLQAVRFEGYTPSQIVHLWSVTPPLNGADEAEAGLATMLDRGFYSLLALSKALGELDLEHCHISVISSEMQDVTGAEQLAPSKATLMGPIRMIAEEYLNLSSRSIDVLLPGSNGQLAAFIERLGFELLAPDRELIVALRGAHRWLQTFEPSPLAAQNGTRIREGGVYLITGGLGGIGLAMAEYLADTYAAKLVLVGRSALPPRSEWPALLATADTTSGIGRRIQTIQSLEARTEVLVLHADVANAAQMRAAVEQAVARFGTINGALHAAGVPGVGIMQRKTAEAAAAVLAPKVQGTLALSQALQGLPLDFLLLFSSVTSATGGGPGQADYCAANAFLDAFARKHHHDHGMTVAVSWGEWLWDAWQEGLQGFPEEVRAMLVATRRAYGISFAEGAEAVRRILSYDLPHVFVTTQDLLAMVEFSKKSSAAEVFKQLQQERQSRPLYPRPPLGSSYVAPGNELEEQIAAIWSEVLRIEQIGVQDNFFDLGGNSLLGIDLISRIRKAVKLETLQTYVLYDAPTVSAMAEYIQGQRQETQPSAQQRADLLRAMEDRAEKRRDTLKQLRRRS